MNEIRFYGEDDFPLTTDVLGFMQEEYSRFEYYSRMFGDKYILYEYDTVSDDFFSGYVVLDGNKIRRLKGQIKKYINRKFGTEEPIDSTGRSIFAEEAEFSDEESYLNLARWDEMKKLPPLSNLFQDRGSKEDFNDCTLDGYYAMRTGEKSNVPDNFSHGSTFVFGMYQSGLRQIHFDDGGRLSVRAKTWDNNWNPWREVYTVRGELGDVDLNTFNSVDDTGIWSQKTNNGAESGSNYPVEYAGSLEVFSSGAGITQRYTTYNLYNVGVRIFVRGYYSGSSSPWSDWIEISRVSNSTWEQLPDYDGALQSGFYSDATNAYSKLMPWGEVKFKGYVTITQVSSPLATNTKLTNLSSKHQPNRTIYATIIKVGSELDDMVDQPISILSDGTISTPIGSGKYYLDNLSFMIE